MRIYICHSYGRRRNESPEILQRNVDNSIRIGLELIKKGHIPIIPLLYHYVYLINGDIPESIFIEIGLELVRVSEALLIATPPADKESDIYAEINLAKAMGIPIYYSLEEINENL